MAYLFCSVIRAWMRHEKEQIAGFFVWMAPFSVQHQQVRPHRAGLLNQAGIIETMKDWLAE